MRRNSPPISGIALIRTTNSIRESTCRLGEIQWASVKSVVMIIAPKCLLEDLDTFLTASSAQFRRSLGSRALPLESHRSWSRSRREILLRRSQWPSGNVPRGEGSGGVTTRDYGQSPLLRPWTRLTQTTRQHLNDQNELAVPIDRLQHPEAYGLDIDRRRFVNRENQVTIRELITH